jgi:hypothetical protein
MRAVALLALAALLLFASACGGSGDSGRAAALAALDQATEAAQLESEMAALVGEVSDDASGSERRRLGDELDELDRRARALIASADAEDSLEADVVAATEETQAAGQALVNVVDGGGSGDVGQARKLAIGRLAQSNQRLRAATNLIRTDLEEQGELSADVDAKIDATLSRLDRSAEAAEAANCTGSVEASTGEVLEVLEKTGPDGPATELPPELCAEAVETLEIYLSGGGDTEGLGGSGGFAKVGDWLCFHPTLPVVEETGEIAGCERDDQLIVAMQQGG